ncbi:MAG TPA: ATP synthase F1 subunit gamma [Candidatus Saccharimonadia bacterium]
MAQMQELQRRVRSISNTRQTTKAMQLVDATKLRRAQAASKRSRDYIEATMATLQRLLSQDMDQSDLTLWKRDKVRSVAIMVIASDRGLAGAYNHNVANRLRLQTARYEEKGVEVKVVAIGAQAIRVAKHLKHATILEQIVGRSTDPGINDVKPLAEFLRNQYVEGTIDAIEVIYTHSISALKQEIRVLPIWPVDLEEAGGARGGDPDSAQAQPSTSGVPTATGPAVSMHPHVITLLEPSAEEVVDVALERLFDASVLNAAQEAGVSEHAMRMLAMRNATDNASDLIDSLTLQINTIRQAGITQEISEITGAAAAIEEQ